MGSPLEIAVGAITGFSIFQLTCPSHHFYLDRKYPGLFQKLSAIKRKLHKGPKVGIKNFEIIPSVRLNIKKRSIWIHHWMWLSVILGFLVYNSPEQYLFAKSVFAGGAIHGFLYKDRFKIISSS
ncbi:hypothetical protein HY024_00240 [Candidatus Curtissbacteria bacterium]|nr:hypothetical protein [Candidatus Curtissbacteria bacterium]